MSATSGELNVRWCFRCGVKAAGLNKCQGVVAGSLRGPLKDLVDIKMFFSIVTFSRMPVVAVGQDERGVASEPSQ